MEQNHDLHAQELSSLKTQNTDFLMLSQKNQSKYLTSFRREILKLVLKT